jgi:cytidine deaminase
LAGSDPLFAAARAAFDRALADYSHFKVGAAIETTSGQVMAGCNIENASYGLTMCAERVAMFTALAEGHRHFRRLLIVANTAEPTPPCGACRQILWEFGGDLEILLANLNGVTAVHRLSDLLPAAFDRRFLP